MKIPFSFITHTTIILIVLNSCKKTPAIEKLSSTLPTVSTNAITNISSDDAFCGGNIADSGSSKVTERGIVWSIDSLPTIALTTKTIDGSGKGMYVSHITGLTASKKYHVRAYASNSSGTSYGNDIEFSTTAPSNLRTLNLYKTTTTDTLIFQGQFEGNVFPSTYRRFIKNNLILPNGVHLYIRFDSVYHTIYAGSRAVHSGDTMRFVPGTNHIILLEAQSWYTSFGNGPYNSTCKYSVWVTGQAMTAENSYYCKYDRYTSPTNTSIVYDFVTDTMYRCNYIR